MSHYISTNHCKHYLKAHVIIVTKYRKPLLVGNLNNDMKNIFLNIESQSDFKIEVFESDVDHIHFLIRYLPRFSISQIVRRLKQSSISRIWKLYPSLVNHYWKQKIFWSDGYFVCSIGEASPDTIRQYILSQG